jgi:alpha-galactosidase
MGQRSFAVKMLLLTMALAITPTLGRALDNGLAKTPPMGWNSWNKFGCKGLNEKVVRETADIMVSSGMKDAGYQFVILDDCWQTQTAFPPASKPSPTIFTRKASSSASTPMQER